MAASEEQIIALKKRSKRPKIKPRRPSKRQRKLRRRQSNKDMILEWLRPRKPLGPRSQGYEGLTVCKYGMKLSTRLGLRLLLCLGK